MSIHTTASPPVPSTNSEPCLALPTSSLILDVFRGRPADVHPALAVPLGAAAQMVVHHGDQWAAEMVSRDAAADDHVVAAAKRAIDVLNGLRVDLIGQIDSWVEGVVHIGEEVPLHTETVGSVVDRLAIAWVRWKRLDSRDRRESLVVAPSPALRQLTELAAAYDNLVLDVHEGRRRLPNWRSLKSYRERR